jgi:hypothetical protein
MRKAPSHPNERLSAQFDCSPTGFAEPGDPTWVSGLSRETANQMRLHAGHPRDRARSTSTTGQPSSQKHLSGGADRPPIYPATEVTAWEREGYPVTHGLPWSPGTLRLLGPDHAGVGEQDELLPGTCKHL